MRIGLSINGESRRGLPTTSYCITGQHSLKEPHHGIEESPTPAAQLQRDSFLVDMHCVDIVNTAFFYSI